MIKGIKGPYKCLRLLKNLEVTNSSLVKSLDIIKNNLKISTIAIVRELRRRFDIATTKKRLYKAKRLL